MDRFLFRLKSDAERSANSYNVRRYPIRRDGMFERVRERLRLISLVQQFSLSSLAILISGMVIIGWWVGQRIKVGVINQTAATTALYVDSFISPLIQELGTDNALTQEHVKSLSKLLTETPLVRQIVSFKIWNSDGRIIYSTDPSGIGSIFPSNKELIQALRGEIISKISDLGEPEHVLERNQWDRLIETYSPVRQKGSERIIAVAEFYQTVDDLQREITAAYTRTWLIVGAATLIMYLLLVGMVRRGSNTIVRQKAKLHDQVAQLTAILAQNEELHDRVRRAATRTVALNERFLRRISAELHDGPAQELGLALLRLDSVIADYETGSPDGVDSSQANEVLNTVQSSLQRALQEVRSLSAGLRLPELQNLNIEESISRLVRIHEKRTDAKIFVKLDHLPDRVPLPIKINLYRLVQEALSNAFRHGGGIEQKIKVKYEDNSLHVEVSDRGPGFDLAKAVDSEEHLGLAGMRERAESLGGLFTIETRPGHGTRVIAHLPLSPAEDSDEG